jgi:hypothetical protein
MVLIFNDKGDDVDLHVFHPVNCFSKTHDPFGDVLFIGQRSTDIDEHLSITGIDHHLGKYLHQGGFDPGGQSLIVKQAAALRGTFEAGLLQGTKNNGNGLINVYIADMQDRKEAFQLPSALILRKQSLVCTQTTWALKIGLHSDIDLIGFFNGVEPHGLKLHQV